MEKNLTDCNNIKLTIGSKIKIKRTEYTIVGEFEDDNKKYFVGKYKNSYGIVSYSNIIYWDSENKRWSLRL